jgi:DNA-binding CsgD family transcriptional regulator
MPINPKTKQAAALVAKGASIREASRALDISEAGLRFYLKKEKAARAGVCPTCGAKRKT